MFSLVFLVCFNYQCTFTGLSKVFESKSECEAEAVLLKEQNPNKELYIEHQCVIWDKA